MSIILSIPTSDNALKATYFSLASAIVLFIGFDYLINLPFSESVLILGIFGSFLSIFFILIDDFIQKQIVFIISIIRKENRIFFESKKYLPIKKAYNDLISESIIFIAFFLIGIRIFLGVEIIIPDGILIFAGMDVKLLITAFILVILVLLIFRGRNRIEEYLPRVKRVCVYYNLVEDPKLIQKEVRKHLKTYESYLIQNNWRREEESFLDLGREIIKEFNNVHNKIGAVFSSIYSFNQIYKNQEYGDVPGIFINEYFKELEIKLKESGFFHLIDLIDPRINKSLESLLKKGEAEIINWFQDKLGSDTTEGRKKIITSKIIREKILLYKEELIKFCEFILSSNENLKNKGEKFKLISEGEVENWKKTIKSNT